MSVYSIKDLEHLSGVKAHTIRIWEQRYDIFSPQRTSTNIRFYTDEDLVLLLNIALLKNHGHKISKIVNMPNDVLIEEVKKIGLDNKTYEDQVHDLTIAMIDLNEPKFDEVLDTSINMLGFEKAMMEIIYPFMNKIGILWLTNSINAAQEHFISYLVRQKLTVATDQLQTDKRLPLFLLFLPEGELHELGILFANYLLRARGIPTIFFGQTVPLNALEEVYHRLHPAYLLTALTTTPEPPKVQPFIDNLGKKFVNSTVLVTGSVVVGNLYSFPENVELLNRFDDLIAIADTIQPVNNAIQTSK